MSKTHLVFSCAHAHPEFPNDRADWLSRLIIDVRPDTIINLGDSLDLPSLFHAEKGKRGFKNQTYRQDINSHLDFQSRLWEPIKQRKKRLPRRVYFHGNHEQRIQTAINLQPELDGAIGFNDLGLEEWYDEVIPYEGNTPGTCEIDGITYAHYFTSGILGRPISSENMGQAIVNKLYKTGTMGHTHLFDLAARTRADGTKIYGTVVGCYQDYTNDWAGEIGKLWDRGVLIKRSVDKGSYDFEWVSMSTIKREYGY